MKHRVRNPQALILAPFAEGELRRLSGRLHVEYQSWMVSRRMHDPDELAARLNGLGASVLIVELDFVFEEVFEAVPSLKLVGVCRSATSHVDIEAATANGVAVVNTPGRNAQAVAEHALGLMLSLARRIPEGHSYVTGQAMAQSRRALRRDARRGACRQDAGYRGTGSYRPTIGGDGRGRSA